MAHSSFFTEILIILFSSAIAAVLMDRLRLPSILGFLLAGVVVGPYGFKILSDPERMHALAELGVVLLMLTIGLEFSFKRLRGYRGVAIIGGTFQILASIGIGILFALWQHLTIYQGFFIGSVIALSSTAIVLKYLLDRGELDTHYGRIAVAILIFQDLAVVPLMIFTTGLAASAQTMWQTIGLALGKTALLLLCLFLFSRLILPHFLRAIARSRNREIFFLASVVFCLGTAWLSNELGLSYAIGAFFAGLMIANTDYAHQLIGEITPFRHVFVSIFFVSIGLLFNIYFAIENAGLILAVVGLVLAVNFIVMTIIIVAFRFPPRIALASGIILCQIGEFSFLLLETARVGGGISPFLYQIILSTTFITMLITPFLFQLVPWVLKLSENIYFFGIPPAAWRTLESQEHLQDHVIVCGFGVTGHDLAEAFRDEKINFIIIEMNPHRLHEARKKNLKALYGDAANAEVLRRAGINHAQMIVVSFGDAIGTAQIVRVARRLNRESKIFVRTRFEKDIAHLYDLGCDFVVMEEWEASRELNRIVLHDLEVSKEKIESHLERISQRKEVVIEEAIMKKRPPLS